MGKVLRSTSWEGPAPRKGDVIDDGGSLWLVVYTAAGPGVGQYQIGCSPLGALIVWHDSVDARPTAST